MKFIDAFTGDVGDTSLIDCSFVEEEFDDIVLPMRGKPEALLKNVVFERCTTKPGTMRILKGATLNNVTFNNIDCGDAIYIASEANLSQVKFIGDSSPKMIWIKPQADLAPGSDQIFDHGHDWTIDIESYIGEVWISGLLIEKVKYNPARHVGLKRIDLQNIDWKKLGVGGLSYWKLMAKKVYSSGCAEAIVSTPLTSIRKYEENMSDLEKLRTKGIVH